MQTPCLLLLRLLPFAASLCCVAVLTAGAAQSPPTSSGHGPAATNPAPAEPEPPKSVFRVAASPQEGRDPFFPQSVLPKPTVITTNNVPMAVAELELKGISGGDGHRLAIINNRSFEAGEEGTVPTNVGRVRVLCKEIAADSVRVIVNGQERTLTLRPR
jgi:hypothetical protein